MNSNSIYGWNEPDIGTILNECLNDQIHNSKPSSPNPSCALQTAAKFGSCLELSIHELFYDAMDGSEPSVDVQDQNRQEGTQSLESFYARNRAVERGEGGKETIFNITSI